MSNVYIGNDAIDLLSRLYNNLVPMNELLDIKVINIQDSSLENLPREIGNLVNLQMLYLNEANIDSIPSEIGNLQNLQKLYLRGTKLKYLPAEIGQLKNLKELNLGRTQIQILPSQIGDLSNLVMINLNETPISSLPDELTSLTALQEIFIKDTNISYIPDSLKSIIIKEAKALNGKNAIHFIDRLSKDDVSQDEANSIFSMDLNDTSLTELPPQIGLLTNLRKLYLRGTKISSLPIEISALNRLHRLDISNTTLIDLPKEAVMKWIQNGLRFIFDAFSLEDKYVKLYNTTIFNTPVSLYSKDQSLIESYYEEEKISLNEAKVLVLGDGQAGKSHTIKRLLNAGKPINYAIPVTNGIDIYDYPAKCHTKTINARIWDFGGQEIMHSMHRCFLTERSLYVIIVANRDHAISLTQRAEFWLNNIHCFAPNSPVLLLVNKIDGSTRNTAIDMEYLTKTFPQLLPQYYVYNAKGDPDDSFEQYEFNNLINILCTEISKLECCNLQFPLKWYQLRNELFNLSTAINCISKTTYKEKCNKYGIYDTEIQIWLLEWFNDLGICFSFHIDIQTGLELPEYQVLDPGWLTHAIYILINYGGFETTGGKLHINTITRLLCQQTPSANESIACLTTGSTGNYAYSPIEVHYILGIMRNFQLSYKIDTDFEFIPEILDDCVPKDMYYSTYPNKLSYRMKYSFLPDTVIHRLMIKCFSFHKLSLFYRNGFKLEIPYDHISVIIDRGTSNTTLSMDFYYDNNTKPLNIRNWLTGLLNDINSSIGISMQQFIIAKSGNKHATIPVRFVLESNADNDSILKFPSDEDQSSLRFSPSELLGMVCDNGLLIEAREKAKSQEEFDSSEYGKTVVDLLQEMLLEQQKMSADTSEIISGQSIAKEKLQQLHQEQQRTNSIASEILNTTSDIKSSVLTIEQEHQLMIEIMAALKESTFIQSQELLLQLENTHKSGKLRKFASFLAGLIGVSANMVQIAETLKPFVPKLLLSATVQAYPALVNVLTTWLT